MTHPNDSTTAENLTLTSNTPSFEELLDLVLVNLKTTLIQKNADYGNSFFEQFAEYGLTSYLIRDEDKLRRLKRLNKAENLVKNESIEDTILDKAGYAVLAYIATTILCEKGE